MAGGTPGQARGSPGPAQDPCACHTGHQTSRRRSGTHPRLPRPDVARSLHSLQHVAWRWGCGSLRRGRTAVFPPEWPLPSGQRTSWGSCQPLSVCASHVVQKWGMTLAGLPVCLSCSSDSWPLSRFVSIQSQFPVVSERPDHFLPQITVTWEKLQVPLARAGRKVDNGISGLCGRVRPLLRGSGLWGGISRCGN